MVLPHISSIQRRPRMKLHRNAKTTPIVAPGLGPPRAVRRVELPGGGGGLRGECPHCGEVDAAIPRAGGRRPGGRLVPSGSRRRTSRRRAASRSFASSASSMACRRGRLRGRCACRGRRSGPGCGDWDSIAHRPRRRNPIHRYEWPRPGDLLHVDIKPLGRFPAGRASHSRRSASGLAGRRLGVCACRGR